MDGPSVAAETFKTLRTIIIRDIASDKNWRFKEESRSAGLVSAVTSPLLVKNRKEGVLVVYVPEEKTINLEDLKIKAEASSFQIAATIRLIQGEETLNKVGHLINSQIQNLESLLKNIMQSAQQVLNCEHVSIFLKEDISGDLVLKESSINNLKRDRFRTGEGLAGLVVQTRISICVPNALKHPQYVHGSRVKTEDKSMLLSPIKSENEEVIGVISADMVGLNGFDSQDRMWLETLTNQAALAIKNAQVYSYVNQRQKALVDVGKKLTENIYLDEQKIYDLIYEQATQRLNMENFFIALYNEKDDMVRFKIACSKGMRAPVNTGEGWKDRKWNEDHKIETIISKNNYLLFDKQKEIETRFPDRPEKRMACSWLGVPMHFGEKPLGVIATYHYEKEYFFNKDDIDFLQALADLTSVAIENARLYAQRNEDIAALQDINEAVISKDRGEILQLIVDKALEIIPGEYSSLWLIDSDTEDNDLVLEAVCGIAEKKAREVKRLKTTETTNSICAHVAKTGKNYKCSNVINAPFFHRIYDNATSALAVPLRYKERIIGVLNVESSKEGAFTNQHEELFEALSSQAAIAIENSRLYNQIQVQRKIQIEAIRHISTTITSPSNIEQTLDNILEWTIELMGKAILGEIRLFEEATNELVVWVSRGGPIKAKYRRTSNNDGITGWVARNKKSQYVSDVTKDPRYLPFLPNTKSEIAVPIIFEKNDQLSGVLNIEHPQINAFTEDDVKLAEAIANLTAIAIENGKLYEEIQKSRDEMYASFKISEAAHTATDLEVLYPEIHKIVGELMPAKNFYIAIYDTSKNGHTFPYFIDEYKKDNIKIESGLAGYVLRSQTAFLGTPEMLEKLTQQGDIKRVETPSNSWMGVPLKTHDKTIGVMAVYSYDGSIIYGEKELDILKFVSEQVAMAIERVQSSEILRRLQEKERAVITLGKTLNIKSLRDENELLERIYKNTSKLMDLDNMYIALYDSQENIVRFGLAYKDGEKKDYKPRPFGKGKTEVIIENREPIFHPTKAESEAWYEESGHVAYDKEIFPSWLGVPMIVADKVLGVIATYHPEKDDVYSESDVEILQAMANIAAIALENAKLYGEIKERANKLKEAHREIAEKEEMLTRSMLASDFVHNLNNLAGTIPVWANILKEKTEDLIFQSKGM